MPFLFPLRLIRASLGTAIITAVLSSSLHSANEIYETAASGTRVTFTANADGKPAPTFKWLKDGTPIPGATSQTLVLASVTTANSGVYNAMATNSVGWSLSNDLILTITDGAKTALPYFVVQPYPSASAPQGSSFSLSATASGSPTPTYQWQKNGTTIPSATNSTLSFASLSSSDAATYSVIASNSAGSTTSGNSVVSVVAPKPVSVAPAFVTQPASQTVSLKSTVSFGVSGTGTPSPTLQWHRNGTPIAGATNASYTIVGVDYSHLGTYTVVATNSAGTVTSNGAVLSLSAK